MLCRAGKGIRLPGRKITQKIQRLVFQSGVKIDTAFGFHVQYGSERGFGSFVDGVVGIEQQRGIKCAVNGRILPFDALHRLPHGIQACGISLDIAWLIGEAGKCLERLLHICGLFRASSQPNDTRPILADEMAAYRPPYRAGPAEYQVNAALPNRRKCRVRPSQVVKRLPVAGTCPDFDNFALT